MQSLSWAANRFSATEENFRVLCSSKVRYHDKGSPFALILGQIKPPPPPAPADQFL
jgi:hypothetical protein